MSGTPQDVFTNEAEQLVGRLVAELRFASMDEIIAQGLRDHLHQVLGKLQQIGWAITQQYFR